MQPRGFVADIVSCPLTSMTLLQHAVVLGRFSVCARSHEQKISLPISRSRYIIPLTSRGNLAGCWHRKDKPPSETFSSGKVRPKYTLFECVCLGYFFAMHRKMLKQGALLMNSRILILMCCMVRITYGQWSNDPRINTVWEQPENQGAPVICTDGDGGAIVAWASQRGIFANRVDKRGYRQWGANGAQISPINGRRLTTNIIPDGRGGAIIGMANAAFRQEPKLRQYPDAVSQLTSAPMAEVAPSLFGKISPKASKSETRTNRRMKYMSSGLITMAKSCGIPVGSSSASLFQRHGSEIFRF